MARRKIARHGVGNFVSEFSDVSMSAYSYSVLGGLMVASGVYHLLYYNGNVLGISGIYGSSVSTAVGLFRSQFMGDDVHPTYIAERTSQPENKAAANGKEVQSKQAPSDEWWRLGFLAGLFSGGLVLKAFRHQIEQRLGLALFDSTQPHETINHILVTFLIGGLVGLGTKVTSPFYHY
jgi:hypothetical protein